MTSRHRDISDYAAQALSHAVSLAFVHDMDEGSVSFLTSKQPAFLDYTAGELKTAAAGMFASFLHPDDRSKLDALSERLRGLDVGGSTELQYRLRGSRGNWIWFRATYSVVHRASDTAKPRALVTLQDISEQHALFVALERRSAELEAVFRAVPDLFLRVTTEEKVIEHFAGEPSTRFTTVEELNGRGLNELFPEKVFSVLSTAVNECRASKKPVRVAYTLKFDGEEHFEGIVAPFLGNDVVVVIRNVSARVVAERQIAAEKVRSAYSARMAELGRMVAETAHEIKSPLSVIRLKAGMVKKALVEGGESSRERDKLIGDIDKIDATVARVSKITQGLLTIARDGELDALVEVEVKSIFVDVLELCQERFRKGGVALNVPDAGTARLVCRPSQIAQVLLNLLNNAFDAVSSMSERWVRLELAAVDEMLEISVTDSGRGIPDAVRAKIMEPFFTTKEAGRGTGLGLSISRGIIENHGGQLWIDPQSKNTRFVIRLPSGKSARPM